MDEEIPLAYVQALDLKISNYSPDYRNWYDTVRDAYSKAERDLVKGIDAGFAFQGLLWAGPTASTSMFDTELGEQHMPRNISQLISRSLVAHKWLDNLKVRTGDIPSAANSQLEKAVAALTNLWNQDQGSNSMGTYGEIVNAGIALAKSDNSSERIGLHILPAYLILSWLQIWLDERKKEHNAEEEYQKYISEICECLGPPWTRIATASYSSNERASLSHVFGHDMLKRVGRLADVDDGEIFAQRGRKLFVRYGIGDVSYYTVKDKCDLDGDQEEELERALTWEKKLKEVSNMKKRYGRSRRLAKGQCKLDGAWEVLLGPEPVKYCLWHLKEERDNYKDWDWFGVELRNGLRITMTWSQLLQFYSKNDLVQLARKADVMNEKNRKKLETAIIKDCHPITGKKPERRHSVSWLAWDKEWRGDEARGSARSGLCKSSSGGTKILLISERRSSGDDSDGENLQSNEVGPSQSQIQTDTVTSMDIDTDDGEFPTNDDEVLGDITTNEGEVPTNYGSTAVDNSDRRAALEERAKRRSRHAIEREEEVRTDDPSHKSTSSAQAAQAAQEAQASKTTVPIKRTLRNPGSAVGTAKEIPMVNTIARSPSSSVAPSDSGYQSSSVAETHETRETTPFSTAPEDEDNAQTRPKGRLTCSHKLAKGRTCKNPAAEQADGRLLCVIHKKEKFRPPPIQEEPMPSGEVL